MLKAGHEVMTGRAMTSQLTADCALAVQVTAVPSFYCCCFLASGRKSTRVIDTLSLTRSRHCVIMKFKMFFFSHLRYINSQRRPVLPSVSIISFTKSQVLNCFFYYCASN